MKLRYDEEMRTCKKIEREKFTMSPVLFCAGRDYLRVFDDKRNDITYAIFSGLDIEAWRDLIWPIQAREP